MKHRRNTPWWASEGDGPLGSGPDNPQLNSRMSLQMLERLCESGPLYAVEVRYGGRKYGKVEVKDGRILINSFQIKEPDSQTNPKFISFPELISRFIKGSLVFPDTIFLRLAPNGGRKEDSFEVIFEMEEFSARTVNFILLCSALVGPSYKGEPIGGDSFYFQNYITSRYVVTGINEDDPGTPRKAGYVYGMEKGVSGFWIQLEDYLSDSGPRLGIGIAGLELLKALGEADINCTIEECGLVM